MLNKEQRPLKIYVCGSYTASTKHDEQIKMDDVSNIKIKMEHLLSEMYDLGKEEGYEEAMEEFHVPDL